MFFAESSELEKRWTIVITAAFTVSAMSMEKNATIAKDRNDRTKSAIITP